MKIASRNEFRFSSDRRKKQTAREFIEEHLDSSHVNIIMALAEEMNMTTEDATAYAVAFFNTIQDLFYMHYNIDIKGVKILTEEDGNTKFGRRFLKEPYLFNAYKASTLMNDRISKQIKRSMIVTKGEIKRKEIEKRKKEVIFKRNQKKNNAKSNEKRRLAKRRIIKRWSWASY